MTSPRSTFARTAILLAAVTSGCTGLSPAAPPGVLVDSTRYDCTVLEARGDGGLIACRQDEGEGGGPAPAPVACEDIDNIAKTRLVSLQHGAGACLPSCGACDFDNQTAANFDRNLKRTCDRHCVANKTCPAGQECVLDRIVDPHDVATCVEGSHSCKNPDRPDRCLTIYRMAECKCKCQPLAGGGDGEDDEGH